ncbi:MAG: hypothetical protein JWM31_482 [Solirubrobacterales bacterium]|nr:hypothetical protein [Solirubrobacterales bacterium]
MLVSWLVFPIAMLVVSAGCGLAVARAAGGGLSAVLVLPVGFATMIVVASAATADGSTARFAAPLVLVVALAGFWVAEDRRACLPDRWTGAAAVGVFVVFGAPVLLSGHATFTGYVQLDDIATWLSLTDLSMTAGRDVGGLAPSSFEAAVRDYIPGGYPIGAFLPLGLGSKFTLGRDVAWLFAPTMALTAGLLCLTISDLVTPILARPRARAAAAFTAAQSALLFSYAEWGAIKEVTAALLVALVAALAPTLTCAARRVLPLAVAVAALVAALSLGGGVWAAPIILVAVAITGFRPRALVTSGLTLVAAVAALSVPSLLLARLFLAPQLKSGSVLTANTELGNLRAPLPFAHVLGIWPAGDFRLTPDYNGLIRGLLLFLSLAAAGGIGLAASRRAGPLLGYVVGGFVACQLLISRGSPWVDAKSMATASPIVLTVGLTGLLWVATERPGLLRRAALGGAAAIVAGVVWSNVLGYANSYVAPYEQLGELERAGQLLAGQGPTLMTEYEPYGARHFLRKADAEGASERRRRPIPLRDGTQLPKSATADIGAFDPVALRAYRSLVLRTSPLSSRPPSAYALRRSGESYDVWQRSAIASTPFLADLPLGSATDPGAVPPCSAVRALAARVGPGGRLVTVDRATPTVVPLARLRLTGDITAGPSAQVLVPADDSTATGTFTVPAAGMYAVWLGGSTRGATTVRIDGKPTRTVRGRLNNQGGMMRFGHTQLTLGSHRISLSYADNGLAPGERGQRSLALPLGPLVLAPPEAQPLRVRTVPAARATTLCGRHLDWVEAYKP